MSLVLHHNRNIKTKKMKLSEEIIRQINRTSERYETAKSEMAEAFDKNPAYTVTWHSEDMMQKQHEMKMWNNFISNKIVAEDEIYDYAFNRLKSAMRRILSMPLMNSTGMVHNVESLQEMHAYRAFAKDLAIVLFDYAPEFGNVTELQLLKDLMY